MTGAKRIGVVVPGNGVSIIIIQTSRVHPTLIEVPANTVTLAAAPQIPQPGGGFQDSHVIIISQDKELVTVTWAFAFEQRKSKSKAKML
jgi:hypothetical protein